MTGWRRHLAALRAAEHPNAGSAESADRWDGPLVARAIGANGAIGNGEAAASTAAFLARAAEEAADALAAPDPEFAWERRQIAAARTMETSSDPGRQGSVPGPISISEDATAPIPSPPEADRKAVLAGLLAAGLQRPPAWSDPASVPPQGAWCGCCERTSKAGGRWWCEAVDPRGWRCRACHPPEHLTPGEVVEWRT